MTGEKFYITTAIDYVNAPPHLGHSLEKIQADILARYARSRGRNVWFLTGTDEHGTKIARAAEEAKQSPEKFVGEMSERFIALKEALNLSWDDFIRTTDKTRHWPGVRLMWEKIKAAGDIYKKTYRGLYCVGHEAFITQRDLVDGQCADHQKKPEIVEEENYFFRLSKYGGPIAQKIKSGELKIFPKSRENEILSLISKGLEDVSFSRPRASLSWGIPVPDDETQTIYVWCDALTNYLSAVGYGRGDDWELWWPANLHVIGKDILRFHAAIWPAMLLSAKLPLPKAILVHGFISVDGQKMSKTVGNVVDPFVLVKKCGADALRYYLLREIPAGNDGDFSERKFKDLYNADLANGLGNFAARVLTLGEEIGEDFQGLKPEAEVADHIGLTRKTFHDKMAELNFPEALASVWELIGFGDYYVNRTKPWNRDNFEKKTKDVFNLIVVLDNVAALLTPFLPKTAVKITESIIWRGDKLKVKKLGALFPRLK